ncbi:unnamed protein product [Tetraodon nigroviridis]|uniref:(spotted green pufferfish) hypothetical protein n=1 Tax=Tetraodon nigroviridis TaxID=99883 RepID=Q4S1D0_TETNG|nr:unnamed protein product [Tetraodon nigroviridis]
MAHGRRAGTISDMVAPGPPLRSGPGDDQRRLVGEGSLSPGAEAPLTGPVAANRHHTSREPHPEDMEDACSEYDNVGSDVEQDGDEVLRLSREAVADVRYCKQVCAEDGDNVKEVRRHAPRSFRGLQSGARPHKASQSFRPYCAPLGKDGAERGVEKGHENRFLLSDGDEVEEVLDGARFIEDLDGAESSVPTQTPLGQDKEKERTRKRGELRKKNVPGGSKRRESSHVDSKDRQGKGRGRRGTAEDLETSLKDSKKGSVRSRARSGRHHPPPSPQKAQHHGGRPPVAAAAPSSAASPDRQRRVVKPCLEEPLEDAQAAPGKPQPVSKVPHQTELLNRPFYD